MKALLFDTGLVSPALVVWYRNWLQI